MAASGSIDWDALLAKLGGDAGVLRELLEVVIATHQTAPDDLRAASRQEDFAAIERLAHRTKGTAGDLVAAQCLALGRATELAARNHEPAARDLVLQLADALEVLLRDVRAHLCRSAS